MITAISSRLSSSLQHESLFNASRKVNTLFSCKKCQRDGEKQYKYLKKTTFGQSLPLCRCYFAFKERASYGKLIFYESQAN